MESLLLPPLVGHIRICNTEDMSDSELGDALRAYRRAEALLSRRRAELFEAIGEAVIERGIRQADVARQTGYTREHIRRICNDYLARKAGQGSSKLEAAE
jgi:CRP-like cAMP-binding protein